MHDDEPEEQEHRYEEGLKKALEQVIQPSEAFLEEAHGVIKANEHHDERLDPPLHHTKVVAIELFQGLCVLPQAVGCNNDEGQLDKVEIRPKTRRSIFDGHFDLCDSEHWDFLGAIE